MSTINVLMVVDVEGALSSGGLGNNIYMIDTTKYLGNTEGGNELTTTLNNGDIIAWSVAPVDPGSNVAISGFTGQAVNNKNIQPQYNSIDKEWESSFNVGPGVAAGTSYQYSATMLFNNTTTLSWDPFLVLKTAT